MLYEDHQLLWCSIYPPHRTSISLGVDSVDPEPLSALPRSCDGGVGRRDFLASAVAALSGGLSLAVIAPGIAGATVNFETERYGDKELKIATVNKLRQQLRNAVSHVSHSG